MRFGVFGSADATDMSYIDYAVAAERAGFESSFLVEHHFSGWNQVSATLMVQACAAMRTTTLRLGTAVIVLPWHNPVLLAEQVATLDVVSGGRVDFGVGRGYRHNEFAGFGVDPADAQARFDEAIAVIAQSWTSRERFTHAGRFWHFDDVVVEPPPVQQPHPPIWLAAASDRSIDSARDLGFNLLLDQYASAADIEARIGRSRARAVLQSPARSTSPIPTTRPDTPSACSPASRVGRLPSPARPVQEPGHTSSPTTGRPRRTRSMAPPTR